MKNKFRDDLVSNNREFNILFNSLLSRGEISEFPEELWKLILRDKTPIKINGEPLAFKDLFHLNLNEGRCKECVSHLVLLLDKLDIYSEAIECVNEYFCGTSGSSYGGHWYVQIKHFNKIICVDTSLVVIGSVDAFSKLGHKVIRKYDIDTLFKEDPSLIDYYESMIINKNLL